MDLLSPARALKHRAFLARKDAELRAEARRLRADPVFRAQYSAAEAGLKVPPLEDHPGPWAIAMVRNEADVIETAVRHLVRQGVDHLLIVDNLSEDDTPRCWHDWRRSSLICTSARTTSRPTTSPRR